MTDAPEPSAAEALLASRRILARLKLELLRTHIGGEAEAPILASFFNVGDEELLEGDSPDLVEQDLAIFAGWHRAQRTDSEVALAAMQRELHRRLEALLEGL